MDIIYRKLTDLKKLSSNPRRITEEQLNTLKESIERNPDYFQARPIILSDRTGELIIIAGNQRYEACCRLGIEEVPTALISGLTEEREREIIIRDNVNNGQWDMELLENWDNDLLEEWGVEVNFNISDLENKQEYTKKIEAPVYQPKRETAPDTHSLFDETKCNGLINEIDSSSIPEEVKYFLRTAATRHIVFDYGEIAEYYAHAPKEVQELMEKSALVIIDFDKAIENGYTRLKEDIYKTMLEDTDDEE